MKSLITYLVILTAPTLTFSAGLVTCNPKIVDGILTDKCEFCQVGQLIKSVADWLGVVLGIVMVLIIIAGGLMLVTSVGNVSAKTSAKKLIATAVVGYVIFLGAWYLVDIFLKFLIPGSTYGINHPLICG